MHVNMHVIVNTMLFITTIVFKNEEINSIVCIGMFLVTIITQYPFNLLLTQIIRGPQTKFSSLNGVLECVAGYAGDNSLSPPTYKTVCDGDGHTEAIMVTYDDEVITYEQLIQSYFDYMKTQPFIKDGQYANKIWTTSDDERVTIGKVAFEKGISQLPTITQGRFWKAEQYHQDYQKKNGVRNVFLLVGVILR